MALDRNNKKFTMATPNTQTLGELLGELGELLPVSRRSDGKYYLSDMCQSPNINRYARYKPEDHPSQGNLTEAQRKENRYGFKNDTPYIKAGFSTAQHSVYEYVRPKGGMSSMNRLRDFNGYYHKAVSPLSLIFPTKLYIDYVNSVSIRANDEGVTNYTMKDCVKIGDVMKVDNDMYVALYIFKDGNNQWLLPSSVKVNDLSSSTFPTFVFACESSQMDTTVTDKLCPYIIPELANHYGEEYTLIAVGVASLTYQSDMKPYALSGSKLIGDRWLFSMELSQDADRKTLSVGKAKVLTNLSATFTMNGTVTKTGNSPAGKPAYWLKNQSSTLAVKTPSDWMFTALDTITFTATINNGVGSIYKTDGTVVGSIETPVAAKLGTAGTTVNITDLLATIGNYNFDIWSGSSFVLYITIKATAANGETKTLVTNYNFTKALP